MAYSSQHEYYNLKIVVSHRDYNARILRSMKSWMSPSLLKQLYDYDPKWMNYAFSTMVQMLIYMGNGSDDL